MKVLFYGSNGWIGANLLTRFGNDVEVVSSTTRIEDYPSVLKDIQQHKPTHVVLAAGLIGKPNVDWCEDHKEEVYRINVEATGNLALQCYLANVHLTYLGTGCIFEYDDLHPVGDELTGYKETDKPNFSGSWYSRTKIMTEAILSGFPNVLVLRIRMPISDDLNARSFITKIVSYTRIASVPNSMTVLSDLIPLIPTMMENKDVGILNFTNPGAISHDEILTLYKELVDPTHTYESVSQIGLGLRSGRSNNYMDTSLITSRYEVPHIKDSIKKIILQLTCPV